MSISNCILYLIYYETLHYHKTTLTEGRNISAHCSEVYAKGLHSLLILYVLMLTVTMFNITL